MKNSEAFDAAKKHLSRRILKVGVGVEFVALQSVAGVIIFESQDFSRIFCRHGLGEPFVGAHPQIAAVVSQNAVDHVVGQTVFFHVIRKFFRNHVKSIQAATVGTQP